MPKKTLTIDLQAGRLGEFIERYEALFPSSDSALVPTAEWIRQHDLLQGNIANEIARQYREQKQ